LHFWLISIGVYPMSKKLNTSYGRKHSLWTSLFWALKVGDYECFQDLGGLDVLENVRLLLFCTTHPSQRYFFLQLKWAEPRRNITVRLNYHLLIFNPDQVKEDELGRACSTNEVEEECI
jgi:hypothetical protein